MGRRNREHSMCLYNNEGTLIEKIPCGTLAEAITVASTIDNVNLIEIYDSLDIKVHSITKEDKDNNGVYEYIIDGNIKSDIIKDEVIENEAIIEEIKTELIKEVIISNNEEILITDIASTVPIKIMDETKNEEEIPIVHIASAKPIEIIEETKKEEKILKKAPAKKAPAKKTTSKTVAKKTSK